MHGFAKRSLARHRLIHGGLVTLLLASVLTAGTSVAAQTSPPNEEDEATTAMTLWSATSPATHQGDQYELVVTNTGAAPQSVLVATLIMDHRAHENSFVLPKRSNSRRVKRGPLAPATTTAPPTTSQPLSAPKPTT